jgi:hypothetical protein
MIIDFEVVNKLNSCDLKLLDMYVITELYALQNSDNLEDIKYWSSLSSMCKTIIKTRIDAERNVLL